MTAQAFIEATAACPPLCRSRKSMCGVTLAVSLFVVPVLAGQQSNQYTAGQAGDQQSGYGQPEYGQSNPYGDDVSPQQRYSRPSPVDADSVSQEGNGNVQPLSEGQLQQLVAPIALYPDNLIAQILAASTYPAQVAEADRWRWTQGNEPAEEVVAGADAQPWDPSVKALTAFPQVLSEMNHNLQWVTELGNAYYNQPLDVLHAVQVMRWRAQAAGNLRGTPQESVTYEQGNIVLAPVNPQLVYVPQYNPWVVYGAPVVPYPGFSLLGTIGSFVGSAAVRFGWGIAMAAFSRSPFGLLAWGLNWLTHAIVFHGSTYYTHSITVRDWGLPHGGPRAFYGNRTFAGEPYRQTGHWQRFYRASNSDVDARSRLEEENRGWQRSRDGYARSQDDGFRSFRQPPARTEQHTRSGWGFDKPGTYRSGRDTGYRNTMQANRSSREGLEGGNLGKRAKTFKGHGFVRASGKRERSYDHFRAQRAPKSFASRKSPGHGHSSGHEHSGKHHG